MICFIHVPKTAGTVIRHLIRQNVGIEHMIVVIGWEFEHFWTRFRQFRSPEMHAMVGHLPYGYHTVEPATDYCTVLRHPLDRTLADFDHLQRDGRRLGHTAAVRSNGSLAAFLDADAGGYRWIDNAHVRYLSGYDPPLFGCTEVMLEQAKANLATMLYGFQDDLDAFVRRLCNRHGWPIPDEVGHHNVAPTRTRSGDLSTADYVALSELNALDLRLYAWALTHASTENWHAARRSS